jgi:putative transposase
MNKRFANQRKSLRLEQHNYSSPGAYFVTICSQLSGFEWFGGVSRDGVVLNAAGQMVENELHNLSKRFANLELDTYIIMPDHIHATLVLSRLSKQHINHTQPVGAGLVPALPHNENDPTDPNNDCLTFDTTITSEDSNKPNDFATINADTAPHRATTRVAPTIDTARSADLGSIIGAFKSLTTRKYIQGVRESGWTPFEKRLWERSYFERVLRDESELETRRNYILENPLRAAIKRGLR